MDDGRAYGASQFAERSLPPLTTSSLGVTSPTDPDTPHTPMTPSGEGRKRKANPLNDLIDTEKVYVDQLTGIIRKVASAWSRSNLPPPELDKMFRGVEAVYKANRALGQQLNDIGGQPDQANPKALGDLLMRWVDDLEGPYMTYCTRYSTGFDRWPPVANNERLPGVLATYSAQNPPEDGGAMWTLDGLFILPQVRLRYYRKLYSKLLKSTQPGRSDHKLLVGAVDKLDNLLNILEDRSTIDVGYGQQAPPQQMPEDEVVMDLRSVGAALPHPGAPPPSESGPMNNQGQERQSFDSNGARSMRRASVDTFAAPISDLEYRLSTDSTLDIFTMKPKQVRLQIAPPSLGFTRQLLLSEDCLITFVPRSTGQEVVMQRGHIYILSDLFLICERMTSQERAQYGSDGADTWLCYPPLAGKHLRLTDGPGDSFEVTIMRKETLVITAQSPHAKSKIMAEFQECIDFATHMHNVAKAGAPPPVPPLDTMPPPPPKDFDGPQNGAISPGSRVMSPEGPHGQYPPPRGPGGSQNPTGSMSPTGPMGPVQTFPSIQQGLSRAPSSGSVGPGQMFSPQGGPPLPQHMMSPPGGGPPFDGPPQLPFAGPGGMPRQPSSNPASPPPGPHPMHGQPRRASLEGQRPPFGGPPGPGFGGPPGPPGPPGPGQPPFGPGGPGMNRPPMGPAGMGPPPPGGPLGPNGMPPGPPGRFASGPAPGQPGPPGGLGPPMGPNGPLRKAASSGALANHFEQPGVGGPRQPMPGMPPRPGTATGSADSSGQGPPRMLLPSALNARVVSMAKEGQKDDDESPPNSPIAETAADGPVTSSVVANFKCKVFLQQHHAAWKSLGTSHLRLFLQQPTNVKQLVVEADDKKRTPLISTIVLSDGVERVGKTGIAIELTDNGARTGIVYMIQLKNESNANDLFANLIHGSDRSGMKK